MGRRPLSHNLLGIKPTLGFLLWRDHGICGLCLSPIGYAKASREHLVPRAHGGFDCHALMVPAHAICNSQKRDRMCHWTQIRWDLLMDHEVVDVRKAVRRNAWNWGPQSSLPGFLRDFLFMGGPPPTATQVPPPVESRIHPSWQARLFYPDPIHDPFGEVEQVPTSLADLDPTALNPDDGDDDDGVTPT